VEFHVSLIGRRDLAGEIYRQLRAAILERRLQSGEALPPTRELAARLSVARTTVSVAYDRLVAEGFAISRTGAGTFVAHNLPPPIGTPRPRTAALRPRPLWDNVRLPIELWRSAKFDFRAGIPDARLFPYETWRRLLAREFRPKAGAGVYGHPAGHTRLREAIVQHVATSRGVRAEPDDVVVTNGTQQAVDLIARVLLAPGEKVAVEDPCYGTPRRLLASLGLHVCGVPVDSEGLIVDSIPPDTRLVYVSPSHQFPLGMSMSLRRRVALLEWAKQTGGAIIEDDYDSEFRFGGRPIEPVHMLDNDGRVIYVGSFSKTMLPTLRLGFIIAPPSLHAALQYAKYIADWHTPLAVQAAMACFIEEGYFARHLRRMRRVYEARHRLIVDLLTRFFAEELELVPSSVGLHVAAFARNASVERIAEVLQRASELGVECMPLSMYAVGDTRHAGILLGYGAIATDQIEEGLGILRGVLLSYPEEKLATELRGVGK
jgi:GntR family transcriptional regulator/MocR family aminotransferase